MKKIYRDLLDSLLHKQKLEEEATKKENAENYLNEYKRKLKLFNSLVKYDANALGSYTMHALEVKIETYENNIIHALANNTK